MVWCFPTLSAFASIRYRLTATVDRCDDVSQCIAGIDLPGVLLGDDGRHFQGVDHLAFPAAIYFPELAIHDAECGMT